MREVISRRFRRLIDEKGEVPDLVVIDGGKGQLSSAVTVLKDLGIDIANESGTSDPDKIKAINIIGLAKRLEEVFQPNDPDAHTIPKTSSGLKLLQRIRDEAHRFAITFHRDLRSKRTLISELNEIKGIGENSRVKLMKKYGSFEEIKKAVNKDVKEFEIDNGKRITNILRKYFSEEGTEESNE
jgi:excinuclease ABC subunit C